MFTLCNCGSLSQLSSILCLVAAAVNSDKALVVASKQHPNATANIQSQQLASAHSGAFKAKELNVVFEYWRYSQLAWNLSSDGCQRCSMTATVRELCSRKWTLSVLSQYLILARRGHRRASLMPLLSHRTIETEEGATDQSGRRQLHKRADEQVDLGPESRRQIWFGCCIIPSLSGVCAGHTFTEILTFRLPRDSRETSL